MSHKKNLFGIDISFSYLQQARLITKKIICANATNIPLKDSVFQTVYSSMFEHTNEEKAKKVVVEMFRVASNDGSIIIKCSLSHFEKKFFDEVFLKIDTTRYKIRKLGEYYLGKWSDLKSLRFIMHLLSFFLPFARESYIIIAKKYPI